jgi:hypothetical protein
MWSLMGCADNFFVSHEEAGRVVPGPVNARRAVQCRLRENFGSWWIRSYFFLQSQIGSGDLKLSLFFLSRHCFLRNERPERMVKVQSKCSRLNRTHIG